MDTFNLSSCLFLDVFLSFINFPPCDPTTLKLRPMCAIQCPTVYVFTSECFREAISIDLPIADAATLYDGYNCSDSNTLFPGLSRDLIESQQNCYNVSYFDSICKYIIIWITLYEI